jgi:hypothetical protein
MTNSRDKNVEKPSKEEFSAPVGAIIQQLGALSRQEQLAVARMACGLVGGYLSFPGATVPAGPTLLRASSNDNGEGSSRTASSGRKAAKGPAKQAPKNPLAGSEAKKTYDAAKKAVSKFKSAHKGEELPLELKNEITRAKLEYFRFLGEKKDA